MDDLARGWAIAWAHIHGHGSWAVWIAIFTAVWIPVWVAMAEKKKRDKKSEARDFRPIPRTRIQGTETRIPGSEKDYRGAESTEAGMDRTQGRG